MGDKRYWKVPVGSELGIELKELVRKAMELNEKVKAFGEKYEVIPLAELSVFSGISCVAFKKDGGHNPSLWRLVSEAEDEGEQNEYIPRKNTRARKEFDELRAMNIPREIIDEMVGNHNNPFHYVGYNMRHPDWVIIVFDRFLKPKPDMEEIPPRDYYELMNGI